MIRLTLFFLVLSLAAVSDIRKRMIPDWMPLLIAGVSLLPPEPVYLTGLLVALPLLIAGITVGGIGGGDIKLTGACGLVLGFERTLSGLLMALMFLLLFHWAGQCIRKCKKINCGVGEGTGISACSFLTAWNVNERPDWRLNVKKKLVVVGMLATIAGVVAAFKSRKKYTKVRKNY